MSTSFSLTPAVQVFPCPNCRETINTSMPACNFCGKLIDHAAAEQAAADTTRISAACSDASYLKVMAGLLLPFLGIMFIPLLNLIGGWPTHNLGGGWPTHNLGGPFMRDASPAHGWGRTTARTTTSPTKSHPSTKLRATPPIAQETAR